MMMFGMMMLRRTDCKTRDHTWCDAARKALGDLKNLDRNLQVKCRQPAVDQEPDTHTLREPEQSKRTATCHKSRPKT